MSGKNEYLKNVKGISVHRMEAGKLLEKPRKCYAYQVSLMSL